MGNAFKKVAGLGLAAYGTAVVIFGITQNGAFTAGAWGLGATFATVAGAGVAVLGASMLLSGPKAA